MYYTRCGAGALRLDDFRFRLLPGCNSLLSFNIPFFTLSFYFISSAINHQHYLHHPPRLLPLLCGAWKVTAPMDPHRAPSCLSCTRDTPRAVSTNQTTCSRQLRDPSAAPILEGSLFILQQGQHAREYPALSRAVPNAHTAGGALSHYLTIGSGISTPPRLPNFSTLSAVPEIPPEGSAPPVCPDCHSVTPLP
jgi:hypothetical protein